MPRFPGWKPLFTLNNKANTYLGVTLAGGDAAEPFTENSGTPVQAPNLGAIKEAS